jgi:hypothetical protein
MTLEVCIKRIAIQAFKSRSLSNDERGCVKSVTRFKG